MTSACRLENADNGVFELLVNVRPSMRFIMIVRVFGVIMITMIVVRMIMRMFVIVLLVLRGLDFRTSIGCAMNQIDSIPHPETDGGGGLGADDDFKRLGEECS
jgi:hypothetical protein